MPRDPSGAVAACYSSCLELGEEMSPEESKSTMSETDRTARVKKPIWKRWWVIVAAVVVLIGVISSIAHGGDAKTAAPADGPAQATDVADVSTAPESKAPASVKTSPAKAVPAEYASALVKAEMYATTMSMSKTAVYDQLVSPAGEQFSKKAATYAIEHVKADWKANALAKAKTYQKDMAMSPAAIRDQLTASAGERFTAKQADYAIAHLND